MAADYIIHFLALIGEVPFLDYPAQFLNHRQQKRLETLVRCLLPAQAVNGQAAHVAWIDPPPTKRLDDGETIDQIVVAHEIVVGSKKCLQIVTKGQINRRTVVQS